MKEKGSGFFTVVVCIVICICSLVSIIYSLKTASVNDKKHVIKKNLDTKVEFLDGSNIELSGANKNPIQKNIAITNNGETEVYIDLVWESIDLTNADNVFEYYIYGTSAKHLSVPSKEGGSVPSNVNSGILMGEKIGAGDTVTYNIAFAPISNASNDAHGLAKIGINIRS